MAYVEEQARRGCRARSAQAGGSRVGPAKAPAAVVRLEEVWAGVVQGAGGGAAAGGKRP